MSYDSKDIIAALNRLHWLPGAPVILVAGSLGTSWLAEGVEIRLEFQSLVEKTIKHLYFSLDCTTANGKKVLHSSDLSFLDLSVTCAQAFGLEFLVWLPERDIREYKVIVDSVVYADGSKWENPKNQPFAPLDAPQDLSVLGELEAQYRRIAPEVVQHCIFEDHGSWWRCGCRQINLDTAKSCIICGISFADLKEISDRKHLKKGQAAFDAEAAVFEQKKADRWKKLRVPAMAYAAMLVLAIAGTVFSQLFIMWEKQVQYEADQIRLDTVFAERKDFYKPYAALAQLISVDGDGVVVGVREDGTVIAAYPSSFSTSYLRNDRYGLGSRSGVVAISAGDHQVLGIRDAGIPFVENRYSSGRANISSWGQVVAVSAGNYAFVGLRTDGTLVADDVEVLPGNDYVSVSAGNSYYVALRSNGTVAFAGSNLFGQGDVSAWRGVVAVSAGNRHVVALRADGTVIATGSNNYGQCDVSSWTNIVSVSVGDNCTLGLRADGTVVAVGINISGVSNWKDIVAISSGGRNGQHATSIGLRADGTVVTTSRGASTSDWDLLDGEREYEIPQSSQG